MIRRELRFEGRVQGVGFRATAQRIARGHRVAGWVTNNHDGSVSLAVEGAEPHVAAFLAELRATMGKMIRAQDERDAQPIGETDFVILR